MPQYRTISGDIAGYSAISPYIRQYRGIYGDIPEYAAILANIVARAVVVGMCTHCRVVHSRPIVMLS